MTPAVTTLLLMITVVPLASYSPPVKLLPDDTRVTQTRGRIENQDNKGTGLASALPLWQQGEFIAKFQPHQTHTQFFSQLH